MIEMQNPGREPGRGETVCKCDLLSNSTLNQSAVSRDILTAVDIAADLLTLFVVLILIAKIAGGAL